MFELDSLHQKIIHFPIAFLVVYPFSEIVGVIIKSEFNDKFNLIIITLGIVGLTLALITGNSNLNLYSNISLEHAKIINKHIEFANLTAWSSGILFLLRVYLIKRMKTNIYLRVLIIFISFIVFYLILKTGEYGGLTNEIIHNYKSNF